MKVSRLWGVTWKTLEEMRTPLRVTFEAAVALAFGLFVFEDLPPIENCVSNFLR